MNMNTPERFRKDDKSEITDDEQKQLEELEAAADAARVAGVYDPSETEEKKRL